METIQLSVRLPVDLVQQLRLNALVTLLPIQAIVRVALESHLSYYTLSDIPNPDRKILKNSSTSPIDKSPANC